MSFIRGVILAVISFLLLLMLVYFGISLGLNKLLYPQIYEDALEKGGAYDLLGKQFSGAGSVNFILIDKAGVKQQVNEFIEKSLEYIRGDSGRFELYWDINKTEIRDFFEDEARKFPVCRAGESSRDAMGEIKCRPSNTSVSQFLNDTLKEKNITLFESSESRINVLDIYDRERNIDKAREAVMWYKFSQYALALLIIIFMALIVLISKDKLRGGLKKAGATIVAAGVWIFILAKLSAISLASQLLSKTMQIQLVGDSLNYIVAPVFDSISMYGLVFVGAGTIVFIASFFFGRSEDRTADDKSENENEEDNKEEADEESEEKNQAGRGSQTKKRQERKRYPKLKSQRRNFIN